LSLKWLLNDDVTRERKRDALNAIRRLAIYHDDVLCSQLHPVTVAVVAEVCTTL